LEAQGVSYALVGGLAVSVRGQARVTADVDLVIAADIDRALTLLDSLATSDFKPLFADVAEVVRRSFILPLLHRRTNVKVDLAIGVSGFEQQAVARAERLSVAGVLVSVATAEDLVVMKALAGRPQDEQDLQGLAIARGQQMDWNYCLNTASELGTALDQDLAGRIRALRAAGT
jgi:predicted nucleotidyltransferase